MAAIQKQTPTVATQATHLKKGKRAPSHIKIAIIENDAVVRDSLAQILATTDDLPCASAHDAADAALAALPKIKPAVIFLGEPPAGLTSADCIRRLKTAAPQSKLLFLSCRCDPDILCETMKAGADGYLVKPFSQDEIVHAIRFCLAGGRPMSPAAMIALVKREASSTVLGVLTTREHEIMRCLEKGLQYKEIAAQLGISTATVTQHLHHIYEKLGAHNKIEAVNKLRRL